MAEPNGDVFPWLKTLPLAPEYRPTLAEFQDPIGYIFKIEKEASKYGICKIIPPFPPPSRKTVIVNLNRSLSNRPGEPVHPPTFTTRQQQIGFCPRRPRPVQRPVWQSGEHYTFQEFEAKAKSFEKSYLKKHLKVKGTASALETETLFWKATVDKPFSVEYANDMPGSAFVVGGGRKCRETGEVGSLAESAWNMRGVSRANGSLLRFMKEEIPGVTSPMIYLAMLFSWFAWHVEDHDLHSLNYLHMGAGKTWYGVPRDAAVAFEEVVRVHGYGGEINPLVTFATLGEKTTVMSPEVFISAGVPCCRLVQNAGEFVVTFPRAYHTGFSHGFNCGEAANIATPEWLTVARDAAIRRASINYPPMVSHLQLLYDLALASCSRIPTGIGAEPRSSRLKDKKKGEGETVIKKLFVQDALQNNDLLHGLSKGSAIVLLPHSSYVISVCSKLRLGSQQLKLDPGFSHNACHSEGINFSNGLVCDDLVFNRHRGIKQLKGFYSVKDKFSMLHRVSSFDGNSNTCTSSSKPLHRDPERETSQGDELSDQKLFTCVTCGILSFSCVAIVQPREPACMHLMSADCSLFNDRVVGSGESNKSFTDAHDDATIFEPNMYTGWTEKNALGGLYDVPFQSAQSHMQSADQNYVEDLISQREKGNTALALLASAYRSSSDSEEDQGDLDTSVGGRETNVMNSGRLPSDFQDSHASLMTRLDRGDDSPGGYKDYMHHRFECNLSRRSFDHMIEKTERDTDTALGVTCKTGRAGPNCTVSYSQNTSFVPPCYEDSSRMHVFCLEHAAEAEKQLRPIGGAHILLLCHPDYPKMEAEAMLVAEDLGTDYTWKNIAYRHATEEDGEMIHSALDSAEAIHGNGDWAVKLGINLFYSANLSRSPLYSKQMPYNSVIYKAFGCSSPASSPIEPKVYQRRANRQKKVVVGKWCGKVWMSHQVHPLLVKRDFEDVENEKRLHGWILPGEKIERLESSHKNETPIRKLGRKRKMTVENERARKESFAERDVVSDNSAEDKHKQQPRSLRSKLASHIDGDDATLNGDSSPYHRRRSMSKETNCTESDVVSDISLDNHHLWQMRKVYVKEGKFDKAVISDDTMDCDSDQGGELNSNQVEDSSNQFEDTERDENSDDSLDVGSLQSHGKTPKRKVAKYSGEDIISDEEIEDRVLKQQRKIPKCRQGKHINKKNITTSDDQHDGHYRKYQRRAPKGRLAKCVAGEDIMSDDQLEVHFQEQQTSNSSRRQNKGSAMDIEEVVSDDQVENHLQKQQRRFSRRKQNKCVDGEVMDDSAENNGHLLHVAHKRKQVKCVDDDDIDSDNEMNDDSERPQRRILRSKQSKPKTLKQLKQPTQSQVKNQTSRPVKGGSEKLMKSKAPHVRNNQAGKSRELSLNVEEEKGGGPSTRLRKRAPKVQESDGKSKEKQTKGKRVKNATAAKVSTGHAKRKDEETEHQCDIEGCSMSFGSKQELMTHKKNICPVKGCGKKFFSHKYLVQHRRVHEDDRPLKCPWRGCKMTFKWAWARTEHIRVHTGARPYVCAEPGCGQTFRFVSDFSRHKRKTGHSVKESR